MLNRVVLVGRLTKDPELRYTPNGAAVATFTLAVNRTFTNQSGEREADFINCVTWRRQAENVANFLKKGSLAGVDGRLQTRNYENQQGQRVFVTEVQAESVQFLEPKTAAVLVQVDTTKETAAEASTLAEAKMIIHLEEIKTTRDAIRGTALMMTHLPTTANRLTSRMMIFHSNVIIP